MESWRHDPARRLLPPRGGVSTATSRDRGRVGLEGVERFVADTRQVFDKFELRHEFADLGERVLAWGDIHIRAKTSGIETDIESGGVFEFREGKIVRWEDFGSRDKALEAIGSE